MNVDYGRHKEIRTSDKGPLFYNKKVGVVKNSTKENTKYIANINITPRYRKKRRTNELKKQSCDLLKFTSLTAGLTADVSNVATSAFSSANFFGLPIGAIGSGASAAVSTGAYNTKYATDVAYIANGCEEISFEEIKEILSRRLDRVDKSFDRNYGALIENLEAIHRNYQAIKRVNDKVDRNLVAIQSGFTAIADQFSKTRNEIKEVFEKIRSFVRQSKIEETTSVLFTFVEYFTVEKNALKYYSHEQLIAKLEGEDSILTYLKKSRTPHSTVSLHVLLNNIINQRFAIPESATDEIAFTSLYLLCLGTETYIFILSFLLNGYNYLADDSYRKNNIKAYNQYFAVALSTLKDFTNSLNGVDGRNGLIDKVINILNTVQGLDFIKNKKSNMVEFVSNKIDSFNQIKSHITTIDNLPNNKPSERIRCNFTDSLIPTPFLEWRDGRRVSYAVQYMNKGIYSQVGDWSVPYTVYGKACPTLDIGNAPRETKRFIFRKFDSDLPELVGIVEYSHQIEFRDIHRDLYNSVLEANEEIQVLHIDTLINNGANVTARFEKERQAVHLASQTGNLGTVLTLVNKGADIDARDVNGYTLLHIAAELGYENFLKALIEHGADVNVTSYLNWSALHVAAEKGNVKAIKNLLQVEGVAANARAVGGFTPLHIAVSSNKNDAVSTLSSDERTDVNAQSEKSLAPLHLAALAGYEQAVETLLSNNKINVNLKSQGNLAALHLASIAGNTRIVEQIIAHNETDINARSEDGWTPLHLAILLKKEGVVSKLLNTNETNINAEGADNLTPLHLTAFIGQKSLALTLLNRGAALEACDAYDYTPLHLAAEKGRLEMVSFLFEQGANLNKTQKNGYTPLGLAALRGQIEIVDLLAAQGASIHVKNKVGLSPIDVAAVMGYLDIVKSLIEKGANFKESALYWAIYGGQLELVKYLIEVKEVDFTTKDGKNILHLAAEKGQLKIVEYLIDTNQADFTIEDNTGKTPLHWAAENGHLSVLEKLLEKGADIHAKNDHGNTPLHLAAENGHLDVVQKLLDNKGADVNAKTATEAVPKEYIGATPLHWAAKNGHLDVVQKLLDKGADINAKEKGRDAKSYLNMPLHYAAYNGHLIVVKKLLERGADVNAKTPFGFTPLHMAAKNGHFNVVEKLLDKGADINAKDQNNRGKTVLHWAAGNGNLSVLEKLLEKGADIHAKNDHGNTPLHLSAENGHLSVLEKLLEKGADIHASNKYGQTPLTLALAKNNRKTISYFYSKGIRSRRSIGPEDLLEGTSFLKHTPFFYPKSSIADHSLMRTSQAENQNSWTELHGNVINNDLPGMVILANFVARLYKGEKYKSFIGLLSKDQLMEKKLRTAEEVLEKTLNMY